MYVERFIASVNLQFAKRLVADYTSWPAVWCHERAGGYIKVHFAWQQGGKLGNMGGKRVRFCMWTHDVFFLNSLQRLLKPMKLTKAYEAEMACNQLFDWFCYCKYLLMISSPFRTSIAIRLYDFTFTRGFVNTTYMRWLTFNMVCVVYVCEVKFTFAFY